MRSQLELTAACVLATVGCGTGGPGDPSHDASGITGIGDTDETGDVDDDDFDPDDWPGTGTGAADDGAGPPPEVCADEAPAGFEIPTDPSCMTEPSIGVFTPVVEWTKRDWTSVPGPNESVTTPIVVQLTDDNGDFQIDDDDTPDVAYVTYNGQGVLRAISGDGTAEVLSVPVNGFNRTTGISAADIDADGIVEILGIDGSGVVIAFEHTGDVKWSSVALGGHVATHDNAPAISDMDGDGIPEIVAGRAILSAAGVVLAAGEHGRGSSGSHGSLSFAVDLDGDGEQEVVVGNAVYRLDGSALWYNGENDGFPAVADFELDAVPEIVVVDSGHVRLQRSTDGGVLWTAGIPGGNGGPPTVADFDGDGRPEIGVAGANSYTVFEGDGTQLWTNVTQDLSSGITGSSVFDFEGDGVADVVYADETRLWVYAGHDGTVKLEIDEHSSGTRIEYPIVADVDGDGEVEIAFVNEEYQGNYRGLTVVGDANNSWQAGRKIWNQHAYHITNVADDGSVPAAAMQNWKLYNNFRSGHTGPNDGLAIPGLELHGDVCELGCDETGLRAVWIQLGNGGAGELSTSVTVDVLGIDAAGDEVLIEAVVFDPPLPAGTVTDGVRVDVDPQQWTDVRARAHAQEIVCNQAVAEVQVTLEPCPEPPAPAG
jgi:hypothetical protein